jgi:spore germination cell wall hydrolase CwlJ-like protein
MRELVEQLLVEQQVREDLRGAAASAALAGALLLNPIQGDAMATKPHTHAVKPATSNLVARVIAGEAASDGYEGMKAVACVIQNRGGNPLKVVKEPGQFSVISNPTVMNANYKKVKKIADKLAAQIGTLDDITGGAIYYMTKEKYDEKMAMKKSWVHNTTFIKQIGNHVFLK